MKIYRIAIDTEEDEGEEDDESVPHYTGYDPNDTKKTTAPANWNEPDIQMNSIWSEKTVREFLRLPKSAIVYKSLIPLSSLREELVEEQAGGLEGEEEGFETSYDWSELQSRRTNPPPIVVTRKVDGNIVINDGNHRVRFWSENGYEEAPAWVYDELLTLYRQK